MCPHEVLTRVLNLVSEESTPKSMSSRLLSLMFQPPAANGLRIPSQECSHGSRGSYRHTQGNVYSFFGIRSHFSLIRPSTSSSGLPWSFTSAIGLRRYSGEGVKAAPCPSVYYLAAFSSIGEVLVLTRQGWATSGILCVQELPSSGTFIQIDVLFSSFSVPRFLHQGPKISITHLTLAKHL